MNHHSSTEFKKILWVCWLLAKVCFLGSTIFEISQPNWYDVPKVHTNLHPKVHGRPLPVFSCTSSLRPICPYIKKGHYKDDLGGPAQISFLRSHYIHFDNLILKNVIWFPFRKWSKRNSDLKCIASPARAYEINTIICYQMFFSPNFIFYFYLSI